MEVVVVFHKKRIDVAHLIDGHTQVFVGFGRLDDEPFGEVAPTGFDKPGQVFAAHGDVDVVVPGDEAAMAHSSEQSAAIEPVDNVVSAADAVYFAQDGELFELQFAAMFFEILLKRCGHGCFLL